MFKKITSMLTAAFLLAAGLSVLGASSAFAANIADNSTVALQSADPTLAPCGQGGYLNIGSDTRIRTWTSGDNAYDFSSITTGSFVWDSSAQTAYNSVLNRVNTTRTTFTPVTGTTYTFYRLKQGSTTANYFCHAGQVELLVNGSDVITVWVVSPAVFLTAGESARVSSGPTAEQIAAIAQAKVALVELLKTDKPGTFQQYRSADYIVKNEKVVEKVNAAILKLSIADRSDVSKIAAIVNLENFIDLVSTPETQKYVTGQKLVQLGLVEKTSKNKVSIANKLKKADAASVNTIEKIQEAIAAELKVFAARADRTAAIKAKIAERNK
jgi:hypothetical protein